MNRPLLVAVALLSLMAIIIACLLLSSTSQEPPAGSAAGAEQTAAGASNQEPPATTATHRSNETPATPLARSADAAVSHEEASTPGTANANAVAVAAAPVPPTELAAAELAAEANEPAPAIDESLLSRPLPAAIADLPSVPDPLRGAILLEERREQLADGRIRRLARYTSHLDRAPVIRIEELIAPIDGDEHILYRQIADAGHLLVDAVPRLAHHDLRAAIEDLGYQVTDAHLQGEVMLVAIDPDDLDALPRELARLGKALPGAWRFQAEEIHWLVDIPDDELWGELWGMVKIQAPTVWGSIGGDQDVVVGILDTGIQVTHPDLVDNIWVNELEIPGNGIDDDGNGYIDDINGYDFGDDDNNPNDGHSHGTHVAGTVGARGNNSIGVAGVTHRVRLVACKISNGSDGSAFTFNMNKAKRYLRDLRARGVYIPAYNVSFSGGANSVDKEAFDQGILPVWAAGNSNFEWSNNSSYHTSSPYALYVAASSSNDGKASFSNYGVTAVDLAAPGTSIVSTVPTSKYGSKQGTSMASPMACGVATLVGTVNRSLSAGQVQSVLNASVDKSSTWATRVISGGRVNAAKAVTEARTYPDIRLLSAPDGAELAKDKVVKLSASVNITTNSVTAVRFFANGTELGEDTDGSDGWTLNWTPTSLGTVDLTAEADDSAGRTTKTWWRHRVTVVNSPSAPVAQLQVVQVIASENGDDPQLAVQLSAPAPSNLEINFSLSGSASEGDDYASLPASVSIPAGAFHALISIDITDDALVEGDETLIVTLTSGAGYSLGEIISAELVITDNDLSSVTVAVLDANAGEPDNDGSFSLKALPAPAQDLQIQIVLSGSATEGSDYDWVPRVFTISAGTSSVTVPIKVKNDSINEAPETVVLSVNDGHAYRAGSPSSATLTITSDDTTPIANAGPDQVKAATGSNPVTFTLNGSGSSDPDGSISSYSWRLLGDEIATGMTPTVDLPAGTHSIVLRVTDNTGATDDDEVVIIVLPQTTAPYVEDFDLANGTQLDTGSSAWYVDLSKTSSPIFRVDNGVFLSRDTDGVAVWYSQVIDISGGDAVVAVDTKSEGGLEENGSDYLKVGYIIDGGSEVVFSTQEGNVNGDNWQTVSASGLSGNTLQVVIRTYTNGSDEVYKWDQVSVTAAGGNQPPVADAGDDLSVTDDDNNGIESISLDGSGSSDPDGSIVSWTWKKGGTTLGTGENLAVDLAVGSHTITLTVTDDDGASDDDTVLITVIGAANEAPIADAGEDLSVTDDDNNGIESISLDGSGSSDPDGSIVSYSWRLGGSEIATGVTATVDLPLGVSVITLVVTDDDGATDEDTVIFTVEPSLSSEPKLAAGVITGLGDSWQSVTLPHNYDNAVVVATPVYGAGALPAVTRIRNVATNSFEIRVQNPSASSLSGYTVHWLAAEAGVYTNASAGIAMEVRHVTSTVTDTSSSWQAESLGLLQSYLQPVVLGQVLTTNDSKWSVFWARSEGSRTNPPAAGSLRVGKHIGADTGSRADETLGVIIIEAGRYTLGDFIFQCGLGSDSIAGFDDAPPYTYAISGAVGAEAAVLSAAAMDGGDGGWPVLYGATPISSTQLRLAFDEDQVGDSERSHTDEQVAWLLVENDGTGNAPPVITAGPSANPNPVSGTTTQLSVTASDADADPLSFLWSVTGPATVVMNTTAEDPAVTFQQAGSYTFTVTVSDGQGGEASDAVTVTVGQTPSQLNLD